jgi:integrase
MRLTQRRVDRLRPSKRTRILWDGEVRGFGVRITPNGCVSFLLAYRFHGRKTKHTFGHPPMKVLEARNKAIELRKGVSEGVDPQHWRGKDEETVENLTKDFMELHAKVNLRAGTVRGYREMLRDHILPRIGKAAPRAVTERDILLLKGAMKKTPYRANRCLALVSAIFNKGIKWGVCESNPAEDVPHYDEDPRDFWLTDEEYRALDAAITFYGRECGEAIRLLILTGAREMEVLGAPWSQFDLEHAIWTRPSHATKGKKTEHVPISSPALVVLRRMKEKATSPYLFPGKDGKDGKSGSHRKTIRKPWRQICKAAGLAEEFEVQGKKRMLKRWRPKMRLHDLRHGFASWLVSDGVSLKRVGELLGHSRESTTDRYAHLADKSLRDATNKFGDMITKTVQ